MNPVLVLGISAVVVYAGVLYGVHRLYTAHFQRRSAAGAAFGRRVDKHVMRRGL
ncbi:hypothetical protein [Mesorhizobium sp. ES1-1]|uniref:hypothetical protein n=1 Tax=Mesorhizobium sp. ES1-1 TaxID=2876629 RepID=UPI001CCB7E64|nr:hypothetical protein [Mesorhizobium sp. ES1-1]MBZ9678932.1 hypothetical protein [Mesorhizobium sp. ES1-1]